MMEVLGAPQTHLGLKAMIQEVDEDGDGRISFREVGCFLTKNGITSILKEIYARRAEKLKS